MVDDTPSKRLSILSVLEPLGLNVVQVESGEEALRRLLTESFAVILLDVKMPTMDGYETAELIRMRRQSHCTPIIFVTAHTSYEAEIPRAYASGAVDFIFAPIVPDILRAKVSFFVDLFMKSRELERSLSEVTMLNDQFRDSEARARSVLGNVADGIVTVSDDGVVETFNRAASAMFGHGEHDAVGQPFSTMLVPKNPDDFEAGGQGILTRDFKGDGSGAWMGRRKDGSTFPIELDLSHVQLGSRKIHIACVRDISERRVYTEALEYQALHDNLTGLPNRVLFADRANHAIRAAKRSEEPLALFVLDLNQFKEVNDTLGHDHGDLLLQLVGERLVGCLREGDTVARLGGDEFGILPLGPIDLPGAASVAWKIQRAFEPAFVIGGHTLDVKASIGFTLLPDHGDNIDDLLRRADLAMYDAKHKGAGYGMFASEQEEAPARRLALLSDLRLCIERDELVLHYQPKVDLTTGETVGVEALVRWDHPSGRLLMPADFMPEVERNELMIPITEWVINEALQTLRQWRDQGFDLTMAVNIGARCLAEGTDLFKTVEKLTRTWSIPPEKLTFELTEVALLDTGAPSLLAQLEVMDERLSIDDFGTGYSSLVYLQRLPVAEIKADRSFVTTLSSVDDDAVIVRSVIDLAHNLGARVVAEGVEDEATMNLLIAYGCDEAQGYFFSRPVPGDELTKWLDASPFRTPRRLATADKAAVGS